MAAERAALHPLRSADRGRAWFVAFIVTLCEDGLEHAVAEGRWVRTALNPGGGNAAWGRSQRISGSGKLAMLAWPVRSTA